MDSLNGDPPDPPDSGDEFENLFSLTPQELSRAARRQVAQQFHALAAESVDDALAARLSAIAGAVYPEST